MGKKALLLEIYKLCSIFLGRDLARLSHDACSAVPCSCHGFLNLSTKSRCLTSFKTKRRGASDRRATFRANVGRLAIGTLSKGRAADSRRAAARPQPADTSFGPSAAVWIEAPSRFVSHVARAIRRNAQRLLGPRTAPKVRRERCACAKLFPIVLTLVKETAQGPRKTSKKNSNLAKRGK